MGSFVHKSSFFIRDLWLKYFYSSSILDETCTNVPKKVELFRKAKNPVVLPSNLAQKSKLQFIQNFRDQLNLRMLESEKI